MHFRFAWVGLGFAATLGCAYPALQMSEPARKFLNRQWGSGSVPRRPAPAAFFETLQSAHGGERCVSPRARLEILL